MYRIVSDSSCDIFEVPGTDFASAPLTIYTDERSFIDDPSLNLTEMLDYLAEFKGRSYTSCPSVDAWLNVYEGADEIFVCTLTSSLSGSFNSAQAAKTIYLQQHPEAKICVIDTMSAGPEVRLVVEKLAELKKAGLPFEEMCEAIAEYQTKTRVLFSFRSLHNFAQNGRVSKAVAAAAGILGIRIVGSGSTEATIEPLAKCRGDKKALAELMKQVEATGFTNGKLFLSHTENPELAETFRAMLAARYPDATILVYEAHGLCSYYGERGGIFLGVEGNKHYKDISWNK